MSEWPNVFEDVPRAQSVSVGGGAPRELVPRNVEEVPEAPSAPVNLVPETEVLQADGPNYLRDTLGINRWCDIPTTEAQITNPMQQKFGPPESRVYTLADSEQLNAYNALLKKCDPSAPRIQLLAEDKQFYRGNFIVFVKYSRIWYRLFETTNNSNNNGL